MRLIPTAEQQGSLLMIKADELKTLWPVVRSSSGQSLQCFQFSPNDSYTLTSRSWCWFMVWCWLLHWVGVWLEREQSEAVQSDMLGQDPWEKGYRSLQRRQVANDVLFFWVTGFLHFNQWSLIVDNEWDIYGDSWIKGSIFRAVIFAASIILY